MINQIKRLYNKVFHPLPKLEKGVYPISIKFYPTPSQFRTGFTLEYCVVDGEQWPTVLEIGGYVVFGLWEESYLINSKPVNEELSPYIQNEFKKAQIKGELK